MAVRAPRLPVIEPYDLNRAGTNADAPRVVWLGDSTAAGVGATSADKALPVVVSRRSGDVDLYVLAVSGDTVADVFDKQLPKLLSIDPDIVYISVGANDTTHLTQTGEFRSTYERLLDAIPAHAHAVILGVPDMGSPVRFPQPLRAIVGARGRVLNDIVFEVATKKHAQFVDIEHATGHLFRNDPDRYFADDGFHPSNDGYRLWADAVTSTLNARG